MVCAAMVLTLLPGVLLQVSAESTDITVNFKNTENWEKVYCYYWGGSNEIGWPGELMAYDSQGYFQVRLPKDTTNVLFHNGSGMSTTDLVIPADNWMYNFSTQKWSGCTDNDHDMQYSIINEPTCTEDGVRGAYCSNCELSYTAMIEPLGHSYENGICIRCGEASSNGIVVYFDNYEGWSDLHVYYWSDENTSMVSWPGSPMTHDTFTWYKAIVPAEAQYIIFNDTVLQTADLVIPGSGYIYSDVTGEWKPYEGCVHDWSEGVVFAEPTCTWTGTMQYICRLCGDTYMERLDALGHDYIDGQCSRCSAVEPADYVLYFRNVDSWERVNFYCWGDGGFEPAPWPGVPATQVGEDIYRAVVPYDAHYVIFNNGDGIQTGDLPIPGTNYIFDRNALSWEPYDHSCDHNYESSVTLQPTCTQRGAMAYTCSFCGDSYQVWIDSLGHDYGSGDVCANCGGTKLETCTLYYDSQGYYSTVYAYYWKHDFAGFEETVTYHDWPGVRMTHVGGSVFSVEVPCEANYIVFSMPDGSQTPDLPIPGAGYIYHYGLGGWGEYNDCAHQWQVKSLNAATCTQPGSVVYACANCGKSYEQSSDAIGHRYVDGVCANCNEPEPGDFTFYFDNTDGWEQVYCYWWSDGDSASWPGVEATHAGGSVYSAKVPYDATGIIFNHGDDRLQTWDLPVTEDGYIFHCATGTWQKHNGCAHQWEQTAAEAASCTGQGITEYGCEHCGEVYSKTLSPLGHDYVDGICTRCGEEEGEIIYIYFNNTAGWDRVYYYWWNDYDHMDWPGEEMGYLRENLYYAKIPGDATNIIFNNGFGTQTMDLTIPGSGYVYRQDSDEWYVYSDCHHRWFSTEIHESTCTDMGIQLYTCSVCGDTFTQDLPMVEHDYVGGFCTQCGQKEQGSGVSISGSITSYADAADEVTVELWDEAGELVCAMVSTNGSYALDTIDSGNYTLKVSKANHVTRSYAIMVGTDHVTQNVEICLKGDVNGDGRVDVADTAETYTHTKSGSQLVGYELDCADVNGDGVINIGDTAKIYAHVKGSTKLW